MPTKNITVEYFALMREQRGLVQEQLETSAGTVAEFFLELRDRHSFSLGADRLRVVINEEFVPWNTPLSEGDTIVFIPPVAGG